MFLLISDFIKMRVDSFHLSLLKARNKQFPDKSIICVVAKNFKLTPHLNQIHTIIANL